MKQLQYHNIPPVYDSRSRLLILGSFPSVRSREEGFFYAHPQNRFWRVLAAVLGEDPPQTVEQKKRLLLAHGIALWDAAASSCRRLTSGRFLPTAARLTVFTGPCLSRWQGDPPSGCPPPARPMPRGRRRAL